MSTKEERQIAARALPVTRLRSHHVENCRVLPNRSELLYRIGMNGIAAEVGVASGDFTKEILECNRPRKLHLVDGWEDARYENGKTRILERFEVPIEEQRLVLHQGQSIDVLNEFEDNYFDWVYIDTNHSFGTTWGELVVAASKVKPAGRIAGHDFCNGNVVRPVMYGVIPACHRFCAEMGWQYEYLTLEYHGHFSFCLRRL